MSVPSQLDNVSVVTKANVYFDGNVVSHSVNYPDGTKKSIGLIFPGSYNFNTEAPERMEIVAGTCRAQVAGESEATVYEAGSHFDVPGNSSFDIEVESGVAEYVCSFK
jgi:hypothetical protein